MKNNMNGFAASSSGSSSTIQYLEIQSEYQHLVSVPYILIGSQLDVWVDHPVYNLHKLIARQERVSRTVPAHGSAPAVARPTDKLIHV